MYGINYYIVVALFMVKLPLADAKRRSSKLYCSASTLLAEIQVSTQRCTRPELGRGGDTTTSGGSMLSHSKRGRCGLRAVCRGAGAAKAAGQPWCTRT